MIISIHKTNITLWVCRSLFFVKVNSRFFLQPELFQKICNVNFFFFFFFKWANRIFEKVNVTSTRLCLHENPALMFCLHMSFLKYLNGHTKQRCTKHKLLLTSSFLKRIVWNLFQISSNCPISKWTAWMVRHFLANICLLNSTVETLGKGVKYVQS